MIYEWGETFTQWNYVKIAQDTNKIVIIITLFIK